MTLGIYSLKQTLFEGNATQVTLPSARGEITILDHHRPLITLLKKGALKVVGSNEEEEFFEVRGGFLEIKPSNEVTILVD